MKLSIIIKDDFNPILINLKCHSAVSCAWILNINNLEKIIHNSTQSLRSNSETYEVKYFRVAVTIKLLGNYLLASFSKLKIKTI